MSAASNRSLASAHTNGACEDGRTCETVTGPSASSVYAPALAGNAAFKRVPKFDPGPSHEFAASFGYKTVVMNLRGGSGRAVSKAWERLISWPARPATSGIDRMNSGAGPVEPSVQLGRALRLAPGRSRNGLPAGCRSANRSRMSSSFWLWIAIQIERVGKG
jgi:hypothetical protein